MLPFSETEILKCSRVSVFERRFSATEDIRNFIWHRDREDRIVSVLSAATPVWYFQFDGTIPRVLRDNDVLFIPKESWHRLRLIANPNEKICDLCLQVTKISRK